MPDIAMCAGKLCPAKIRCWRFLATASDAQSYSDFDDLRGSASQCDHFWDIGIIEGLTDDRGHGITPK